MGWLDNKQVRMMDLVLMKWKATVICSVVGHKGYLFKSKG